MLELIKESDGLVILEHSSDGTAAIPSGRLLGLTEQSRSLKSLSISRTYTNLITTTVLLAVQNFASSIYQKPSHQ